MWWGGGMHNRGHTWQGGMHVWEDMHGRGCAWGEGMCGSQGMRGRGHAWQGHAWQGHVWQGTCMAAGMSGRGRGHAWQGGVCGGGMCVIGKTAIAVGSSHPTGMHSCLFGHVDTAILSRIQGNLLRFSEDGLSILHTTGFLTS